MDDGSLVLRPASLQDGPAIEELSREGGLSFLAEREFARPFAFVIVAIRAGSVVGFAAAELCADEAEVLDLAVGSGAQRQGIGLHLVHALTSEALARGATRLLLEVRRGNLAAIRLYERAGFVQVGERPRYYRSGEDALLLACSLKAK